MFPGLGTLINTTTVLIGGAIGLAFGKRVPEKVRLIIVQVIGLATLGIGMRDLIATHNVVFPLVGMVVGCVIGEMLKIEDRISGFGEFLRKRFSTGTDSTFVTGFVTATLLFCIGPLTILGAIEDGGGRVPQLYIIKGTLDGVMMIVFSTIYGIGSLFSAASVLVVQGALTITGSWLEDILTSRMQTELFAAGGMAVIAIGLNLLEIKKIRLGSLLPGLVVTPLLVWVFATPNGLFN